MLNSVKFNLHVLYNKIRRTRIQDYTETNECGEEAQKATIRLINHWAPTEHKSVHVSVQ